MTRSWKRTRGERGASAVEFALIAPVLIVLLLGILELAFLMKDHVSMSSSVRGGARTASAAADAGPGTCPGGPSPPPCVGANVPAFAQAAADTIQKAGTAMPADDIDWLIIYRAGSNGYPIGGTTINTCSTDCVKFVWHPATNKFRYASGTWPSASVNACLNDTGRHTVGIGMQATHSWKTGLGSSLLSAATTMQERTVMQFEPLEADRCKPGTVNAHQ